MTNGQPVIVQPSWTAFLIHLLVFIVAGLLLVFAWKYRGPYAHFVALSVLFFFVCIFAVKFFPPHFRRAMRAFKKDDPDTAISEMETCLAFFQHHPWIDRYRWFVTMNSSAISYREMALLNIAMFHTSAGRKEQAKATYRRALELFPESVVATQALKAIETFEAPSPA